MLTWFLEGQTSPHPHWPADSTQPAMNQQQVSSQACAEPAAVQKLTVKGERKCGVQDRFCWMICNSGKLPTSKESRCLHGTSVWRLELPYDGRGHHLKSQDQTLFWTKPMGMVDFFNVLNLALLKALPYLSLLFPSKHDLFVVFFPGVWKAHVSGCQKDLGVAPLAGATEHHHHCPSSRGIHCLRRTVFFTTGWLDMKQPILAAKKRTYENTQNRCNATEVWLRGNVTSKMLC